MPESKEVLIKESDADCMSKGQRNQLKSSSGQRFKQQNKAVFRLQAKHKTNIHDSKLM